MNKIELTLNETKLTQKALYFFLELALDAIEYGGLTEDERNREEETRNNLEDLLLKFTVDLP